MSGATSLMQICEKVDRIEHFDQDGGGTIIRTFYCEPYTSHKSLLTALRGDFTDNGDGSMSRVIPNADPLYPNFYCFDTKVVPAFRAAIRGSRSSGFDPGGSVAGDISNLQDALSTLDDFDFASNPDALTAEQMQAGGDDEPTSDGYTSNGRCGAFVTATYNPLIFISGVQSDDPSEDPGFDYVDPQWKPITKSTQVGAELNMIANNIIKIGNPLDLWYGLSDSASLPETLWEFTVRRLMVPYLPQVAFSFYPNKINAQDFQLGEYLFPGMSNENGGGVIRCEVPEITKKVLPNGKQYYDFLLKWTVRVLTGEYYDGTIKDYKYGRISWNHQYGWPSSKTTIHALGFKYAYYPIGWATGYFPALAGSWRYMYLLDDLDGGGGNGFYDMFISGFKQGE